MTFRKLMESIGLNDAELSKRLCIGRQTAWRWNRNLKVPSSKVMRKALTKLAGVRMEEVSWSKR